ncbi:thiosulfate/3-mercaptopyruvate sulfurtransferase [Ketogulonicigenium robustum]|uniref:Sulfurtransferase n=1 Tax=Ketogulonicigenium robustum TaxID=92947 RepID=A0A1W6NW29_9RHOB|nr:sulfurtransferase [Ketogulonicigenium robustum]ARO13442.1 thiosulfate/3-mercaptopyruvate sulfurtransferase [Ketogulonicigenium robustum]
MYFKPISMAFAAIFFATASTAAEPLVTTAWLEENLGNPDIALIEVSVNPGVYERGHIPGAVNFVWHTDLVDPVQRDIASQSDLQARLQAAGVNDDTTIILYGDTNNWFAAWGAWVFDVYGLQDVRLLDGGRVAWEAEGRPLDSVVPDPAQGNVTLAAANADLRAFLPEVVAASNDATHAIVDIRSANEYSGTVIAPEGFQETAIRAGHVTGAVNVPWGSAVADDGRFKSADELREIYAAAGVDGSQPIITYCRIGERSSHTWFALSKILGYDVQNYDGSWTEYGNAVAVPVTNPAGTIWTGL